MIFIVAENRDGTDIREFKDVHEAEEFIVDFSAKNVNYGGEILLAVKGDALSVKIIEVVSKIKLEK